MRRIAEETHVLVNGDGIFCFSEVLEEMRRRLRFALGLVVWDADELVFVSEAWVCEKELWGGEHVWKMLEFLVAPGVKIGETGASTTLGIEIDGRDA